MKTYGRSVPKFEENVTQTIDRAIDTFSDRGNEYGDTWKNCQFLAMKSVAKAMLCSIQPEHFRALAAAAFLDMKYQRMEGGYKDDSLIDGINYAAYLAQEMIDLGVKQ